MVAGSVAHGLAEREVGDQARLVAAQGEDGVGLDFFGAEGNIPDPQFSELALPAFA